LNRFKAFVETILNPASLAKIVADHGILFKGTIKID
jgi:hypothetical protein